MSSPSQASPRRTLRVARTWLLSGVPRSGTSLCCRLAGDLPDVVALSEPIRYREYGDMDRPENAAVPVPGTPDAQVGLAKRSPAIQGRRDCRQVTDTGSGERAGARAAGPSAAPESE